MANHTQSRTDAPGATLSVSTSDPSTPRQPCNRGQAAALQLRPAISPTLQMSELKPRVLNLFKVAGLDDSGGQAQTLTLLYTTSPYSKNCSELWHSAESSQRPAMCQCHYVTWECEQSWGHAYLSGCHHLQHRHTARSNEAGALGRGRMHRAVRQHAEGHLTPTQGVRESFLKQMMLELHLKNEQKQPSNLRNTTF